MKKIAIVFCLVFLMSFSIQAQTITLRDTLFLSKATHINNDLANWDSVLVKIMRGATYVAYVKLTAGSEGEYSGVYKPTYAGDFVAQYYAVYSGDIVREEQYFSVLDTTQFAKGIDSKIGTATDPASMATSLFAGQQYIAENMGGGGGSSGCGAGAFACTVQVRDTALEAGINLTTVIVKNSGQTATTVSGTTDANGKVFFALDSLETGSAYKVWLMQIGYNFTFPETMDVRGNATFTYYGVPFVVGAPQCAISDQAFNSEYDSVSGVVVTARVYVPGDSALTYDGHPVSPFAVVDTTGIDGRWCLNLIPNSLLKPDSTKYIFNIKYPGKWAGLSPPQDRDTLTVPEMATRTYGQLKGR